MGGSPRPPRRTPWLRRIVSTLVLLAVLAAVIWGLFVVGSKAVNWVGTMFRDEHQRTQERATPQAVVIEDCTATNIEVTLNPTTTAPPEGAGMEVEMVVVNRGEAECALVASDISVELLAGTDPVWSPTACSSALADLQLLLSPAEPWSRVLGWDGNVYSGCEVVMIEDGATSQAAGEGTYDLSVQLPGGSRESKMKIEVQ